MWGNNNRLNVDLLKDAPPTNCKNQNQCNYSVLLCCYLATEKCYFTDHLKNFHQPKWWSLCRLHIITYREIKFHITAGLLSSLVNYHKSRRDLLTNPSICSCLLKLCQDLTIHGSQWKKSCGSYLKWVWVSYNRWFITGNFSCFLLKELNVISFKINSRRSIQTLSYLHFGDCTTFANST